MTTQRKPKRYETTAIDAIESGAEEIVELADEMRSWYDNMPENFQNGERGEAVNEAADTLEGCDIESRASALTDAIEACEGMAEITGCPEHVLGTACTVCGWNGEAITGHKWPVLKEYEEGSTGFYNGYVGRVEYAGSASPVSYVDEWTWRKQTQSEREITRREIPAEQIEKARQKLRKLWWERAEHCQEQRERFARKHPNAVPKRRAHQAEIVGVEGFSEAARALQIQLHCGKRRPSRRDRLDGALEGIRVGCEALTGLIGEHPEWKSDERIQDVVAACEELLSSVEECDGVEFPGMFG